MDILYKDMLIETGYLDTIENQDGSYLLTFKYDEKDFTTVNKGSITVNGISLTVVNSHKGQFSVALIPYTGNILICTG